MDLNENQNIKSGHGGPRPGAGRKKGSGNKVKLEDLMLSVETATGMPFSDRLALNYALAVERSDWKEVSVYDRALLNKLVADQNHIEIDETSTVESRQAAFLKALETIGTVVDQQDSSNNTK